MIITKLDKLDARIRGNPTPIDIKFSDFVKFLQRNGFVKSKNESSHYIFKRGKDRITVVKPHGGTDGVKPVYIRKALEIIDE